MFLILHLLYWNHTISVKQNDLGKKFAWECKLKMF